jgi:two-component system response regulator DegU
MILIVEDNANVRRMIRALAEDFDSEVRECDDGAEAFAAYEMHRPDWVLMDVAMPRSNGLAATRAIMATFPEARIAIVTNHDDPNMRRAAFEAGAVEYIVKDRLADLHRVLAGHNKARS